MNIGDEIKHIIFDGNNYIEEIRFATQEDVDSETAMLLEQQKQANKLDETQSAILNLSDCIFTLMDEIDTLKGGAI